MKFHYTRCISTTVFLFIAVSCDNSRNDLPEVLIGADPPSIYKGESINVRLTAEENFFTESSAEKMVSEGGLVLRELVRKDDTTAVAAFETDDETKVGIHTFELEFNGKKGLLQISVPAPDRGPGEVTVENNKGSSGANLGRFTITGEGTRFDSRCEVAVEDADGFSVNFFDVVSSTTIDVYYSIALDQEPTQATVVLKDGDYRYEMPFEIVEHLELDNEVQDQTLTKGQVGNVVVYHKDATLLSTTMFEDVDDRVETGEATVGADMAANIPVRVPVDYEGDTLPLTAETYTDGGAFLERVHLEVKLASPSYVALKEAKLDTAPGEKERVFVTFGLDAWDIDNLTVEDESGFFSISDWRAEETHLGSISFFIDDGIEAGGFNLLVDTATGQKPVSVVAVSDWSSARAYAPTVSIPVGDRLYLPVAVLGGDLDEATLTATPSELSEGELEVVEAIYIDAYSAVLDIAVDKNAFPWTRQIRLHGTQNDYTISVEIVASGV